MAVGVGNGGVLVDVEIDGMDCDGCNDDLSKGFTPIELDTDLAGPGMGEGCVPVPLVLRLGGPLLGGGGAAFDAAIAELGSFLLIHFFSSGS